MRRKEPAGADPAPDLKRLVPMAQAGDHEAFAELYRFLEPRIHRWLRPRIPGFGNDREDVFQEIVVKVYRGLATYDPARGEFLAWVFSVAANQLTSHRRRGHAAPANAPEALEIARELHEAREPRREDELIGVLDRDELWRHLRLLTRREAQVVVLRFVVDLSLRDVAAELGTSEDAVSQTQRRALRKLRDAGIGRRVSRDPKDTRRHPCRRMPWVNVRRRLHVFTLLGTRQF